MEENALVEDLLEQARSVIERRYRKGYHEVGAAIHTRSGRTFAAVHLEANVGRIAVCAEAVALARIMHKFSVVSGYKYHRVNWLELGL